MQPKINTDTATQVNVFELPPIWGKRKTVERWFGISSHRLEEMVWEGYVRSVKFGGKSGQRLFRLEDIDETLKKLAYGHTPRRPGRSGRWKRMASLRAGPLGSLNQAQ